MTATTVITGQVVMRVRTTTMLVSTLTRPSPRVAAACSTFHQKSQGTRVQLQVVAEAHSATTRRSTATASPCRPASQGALGPSPAAALTLTPGCGCTPPTTAPSWPPPTTRAAVQTRPSWWSAVRCSVPGTITSSSRAMAGIQHMDAMLTHRGQNRARAPGLAGMPNS